MIFIIISLCKKDMRYILCLYLMNVLYIYLDLISQNCYNIPYIILLYLYQLWYIECKSTFTSGAIYKGDKI